MVSSYHPQAVEEGVLEEHAGPGTLGWIMFNAEVDQLPELVTLDTFQGLRFDTLGKEIKGKDGLLTIDGEAIHSLKSAFKKSGLAHLRDLAKYLCHSVALGVRVFQCCQLQKTHSITTTGFDSPI